MKNLKNLFLIFGVFAGLVACNDAIEIDQPGRLDADAAFQTVADLEAGLFGVYDQFDLSPDIAFQSWCIHRTTGPRIWCCPAVF